MTKVEEVTRAIEAAWIECENAREAGFDQPEVLARAAIAAMRVPDEAMLNAVGAVATTFWIKTWAKMIDAALAEESE
jgi:hypothetical protein